ncbi:MAG: acetyl-CoA carboxylase carboxyltransferase subunit beta [Nitrospirae bacterium]|nr:acetyl-CoA carboxylase carboxyltransferase subunit beta [Nitrospirota bacterium]
MGAGAGWYAARCSRPGSRAPFPRASSEADVSWFRQKLRKITASGEDRTEIPEGFWLKCNGCKEIIYRKEVDANSKICPKCNYHFPISVDERVGLICDPHTFKAWGGELKSKDPLVFKDSVRYRDRVKKAQKKTGRNDVMVCGDAAICGRPVVLGIMDFEFMGGSMGSVVGELVTRAAERALKKRVPLILFSASGGARMQEGILSLMQMAKTSVAIARLRENGVPYISVLTDPTFGGVAASFSMLGDVNIAEPGALIGFAGPRVIEQTIKQSLPEGFQRSEFLLEHGMVDMIVDRKTLRDTLGRLVAFFGSTAVAAGH